MGRRNMADVARRINITRQFVHLYIKGERNFSWPMAKRVAKVMGIKPTDLMTDDLEDRRKVLGLS